ncbi:hypothetical protein [Limosilactobacillus equigenerosi]|uniref:Integral membrane protein n=1 Tax=Limosilactobacillus equigenerosi DSM 18793 = JCM 14505 TaxID=1423742 RepID=A0A0R1V0S5_9LACO|nr:hypothetical protein [Limosilactobacillus equigenerosi]KRL96437.1 hypothetical protein FC21_GL000054 [Limosilactobacillus equigenerosi DSM 18793 = JCM 14505]
MIQILTIIFGVILAIQAGYFATHQHREFLGFPYRHPKAQATLAKIWAVILSLVTLLVWGMAYLNNPILILWSLTAACLIELAMAWSTVTLLLK